MNGLLFGAVIIAFGFVVYSATRKLRVSVRPARVGAIESS
jgi:hypothetical protein